MTFYEAVKIEVGFLSAHFVQVKLKSIRRLRKKSFCCVALHLSSLQRTDMYTSFLKIRAPCIMSFLLCRLNYAFYWTINPDGFVKSPISFYLFLYRTCDFNRKLIQFIGDIFKYYHKRNRTPGLNLYIRLLISEPVL